MTKGWQERLEKRVFRFVPVTPSDKRLIGDFVFSELSLSYEAGYKAGLKQRDADLALIDEVNNKLTKGDK